MAWCSPVTIKDLTLLWRELRGERAVGMRVSPQSQAQAGRFLNHKTTAAWEVIVVLSAAASDETESEADYEASIYLI